MAIVTEFILIAYQILRKESFTWFQYIHLLFPPFSYIRKKIYETFFSVDHVKNTF